MGYFGRDFETHHRGSPTWSNIHQPGGFAKAGFSNLETTLQYQLFKDGPPELALLLGLIVDWGGTGAIDSGLATPWSTLTPTFSFGKGFGDLPESFGWLRAFAVTGQIGYQIPTRSFDLVQNAFIPQVLVYGGSIQYSMPYLKSEIHDYQLPDFINHLFPIVEALFATPVANNFGNSGITTGTINPGVIWVGTYFQVGVEAAMHRCRFPRPAAPLSRRHVPEHDRPAAARRQLGSSATTEILKVSPCQSVSFSFPCYWRR